MSVMLAPGVFVQVVTVDDRCDVCDAGRGREGVLFIGYVRVVVCGKCLDGAAATLTLWRKIPGPPAGGASRAGGNT